MIELEYDPSEALRKLEQLQEDLAGSPIRIGFLHASMLFLRDARINAPVDTGRLNSSIINTVEDAPGSTRGGGSFQVVVGSNVEHAPYVEFGTRPHWPPPGALERWARRHGVPEHLVRRAIGTRGTRAVKYLERAFEAQREAVVNLCRQVIEQYVRRRP